MITVNAMGDICPIPVVKTKKALNELDGPGEIEVLVDNETAVKNVTKMAKSSGASAESEQLGERQYRVLITVGEAAAAQMKKSQSGSEDRGRSRLEMERTDAGPVSERSSRSDRTGWGKAAKNWGAS